MNINPDKIVLFTVIEGDGNNINNNNNIIKSKRLYEQEALRCFKSWRRNGGWLKNIEIICYAPTKNTPSKKTINELEKLNVTYIENYLPDVENIDIGFFLVPLVGKVLEEEYLLKDLDKIMIHIDLDMIVIQEIPQKYFDRKIYVGQYSNFDNLELIRKPASNWDLPLDTSLMISPVSSRFYNINYNLVKEIYFTGKYKTEEKWKQQSSQYDNFYFEEYIVDKMYNEKMIDIIPVQHYQSGEGYFNYKKLPKEEINKIFLWHEHIYQDKKPKENLQDYMDFIKFKQKINKHH